MKLITILFDEKNIAFQCDGNPSINEIIGGLEMVKETLLKNVNVPFLEDEQPKKKGEKPKK